MKQQLVVVASLQAIAKQKHKKTNRKWFLSVVYFCNHCRQVFISKLNLIDINSITSFYTSYKVTWQQASLSFTTSYKVTWQQASLSFTSYKVTRQQASLSFVYNILQGHMITSVPLICIQHLTRSHDKCLTRSHDNNKRPLRSNNNPFDYCTVLQETSLSERFQDNFLQLLGTGGEACLHNNTSLFLTILSRDKEDTQFGVASFPGLSRCPASFPGLPHCPVCDHLDSGKACIGTRLSLYQLLQNDSNTVNSYIASFSGLRLQPLIACSMQKRRVAKAEGPGNEATDICVQNAFSL